MDPELLEEAIKDRIAKTGKKPKAIVPVALYGMPYKADRIMEIANSYDIPVVEDAAEGFGSRFNGQVLGTFGKYGVLSFNGNKMITTSGGGALVTANDDEWREIMMYATQYRESYPYYQHDGAEREHYPVSGICELRYGICRYAALKAEKYEDEICKAPVDEEDDSQDSRLPYGEFLLYRLDHGRYQSEREKRTEQDVYYTKEGKIPVIRTEQLFHGAVPEPPAGEEKVPEADSYAKGEHHGLDLAGEPSVRLCPLLDMH